MGLHEKGLPKDEVVHDILGEGDGRRLTGVGVPCFGSFDSFEEVSGHRDGVRRVSQSTGDGLQFPKGARPITNHFLEVESPAGEFAFGQAYGHLPGVDSPP